MTTPSTPTASLSADHRAHLATSGLTDATIAASGTYTVNRPDDAAKLWEEALGGRRVVVPDPAAVTAYHADLAGAALGVAGCRESAAAFEARLAKAEGEALRLFPGIADAWRKDTMEIDKLPTPFGPLTLRYEGVYAHRTLDLEPGCRPPGGRAASALTSLLRLR